MALGALSSYGICQTTLVTHITKDEAPSEQEEI
jgi:hypothetical protein